MRDGRVGPSASWSTTDRARIIGVATLCLWAAPGRFSRTALWGIATLWVLSVVTTKWAAGAQDDMHDYGFTDAAFQQLQLAHLARTLCLSVAAVWSLQQVAKR